MIFRVILRDIVMALTRAMRILRLGVVLGRPPAGGSSQTLPTFLLSHAPPGKGDINTAPSTNQKSQECAGSNLTKNQFRSRCVRAGIFLKLLAKSEPLFPSRQGFSVHSLSSLPSIPWEGIFATPLCGTLLII